jgi:hypothetical protein
MQFFRSPHDPAFIDNGLEDSQRFEIDSSHIENRISYLFISQQVSVRV